MCQEVVSGTLLDYLANTFIFNSICIHESKHIWHANKKYTHIHMNEIKSYFNFESEV
jgi:hypothetical protein